MIKQVSIKGVDYNIPQAPAIEQRRLLTMLGSKILLYRTQHGITEIDTALLQGALIGCGDELLSQIEAIVLHKTVKHGTEEKITVASFQGSMMAYIELMAEAVKVNLDDFLGWLARAGKEDGQAK